MTEYQQLLQAIEQYYGSGSDQWAEIAKYGIASDQAEQILKHVPGVNIVKNADGTIRSYTLNASENIVSNAEQSVNSNVPAVIKSFDVPANTGVETVTSPTGEAVKQMTFKSGLSKAGNFVFGSVLPAVGAAATGITVGKLIDKGIYEIGTNIFGADNLESFNPDTWKTITDGDDSLGAKAFNTIFGINPDSGNSQMYLDENALAYLTAYMGANGFFDGEYELENKSILHFQDIDYKVTPIYIGSFEIPRKDGNKPTSFVISNNASEVVCKPAYDGMGRAYYRFFSRKPFTLKTDAYTFNPYTQNSVRGTLKDGSVIYSVASNISVKIDTSIINFDYFPHDTAGHLLSGDYYESYARDCSLIALFGKKTNIVGISDQNDAKPFDKTNISDWNDIPSVLNALKKQYPDLWNNRVENNVVQPDGTTKPYTYVPVAMPEIDKNGNPVISSSNQANPLVNPLTAPESLLKTITDILQKIPPINPPDIGNGDTPVAPPVTGSASSLYAIYNPTLAEINSFGAWLWSDNFIDQIKKLFNDPMQAIIGLHKIYAQPSTGGAQSIKVGYLDSGVSSAIVANQYTTIDCGTVKLAEQFHNVFDYAPFTEVNLYLPFIGIVRLDVSDVMRASIHIVYHVDVLSGACLADVKVVRDSSGGTLYQYAGNASVTLPISSGSYMGIVASVAGIAGGIAGTIASGGSALPLIASSASSMFNAHTRVEHSGGFSGNAGAMGGKIPYLIISRPQTAMAKEFNKYIGYPSNFTTKLGSCSGFVKVLECHLENINATKSELDEIDSILKEGVII